MADNALFRGRLTGVITQDSGDTSSPSGERRGLVEYIREDTSLDGTDPAAEKGIAFVQLPNGVPCPFYAAKLHLFGTLASLTPPLGVTVQPRVIVRRDISGGGHACQSVVISPTFIARVDQLHGGSPTDPIAADDFVDLTFFDATNSVATSKLGVLAGDGIGSALTCKAGDLVVVTARTGETLNATPAGYSYAWMCAPMGSGGNATIAQITSGTGQSYLIDIFGNGPSNPATDTSVSALQLQIDPTDTIPAGTWAIAVQVNGDWYIQVAVWTA